MRSTVMIEMPPLSGTRPILLRGHTLWCLCTLILVLLPVSTALAATAQAAKVERALLISSYHPEYPSFFEQIQGVRSSLSAEDVRLDVEFMDSKRFHDGQSIRLFRETLAHKLAHLPPYDVVLTADDNALQFMLDHGQELLPGAPMVFFGVNDPHLAQQATARGNATGVREEISVLPTLEAARRMLPHLSTVYALSDATRSGRADMARVRALEPEIRQRGLDLRFIDLSEIRWDELPEQLKAIDPATGTLLLLSPYRDAQGHTRPFDQGLALILKHCTAPVLHLWRHGIGQGLLGGKIVCQEQQGRLAGELAQRILDGTSPAALPVLGGDPANRFYFDANQLKRLGVPHYRVPEDAEFCNYNPGLGSTFFWSLLVGMVIIALQGLGIGALIAGRRKLRAHQQALSESEERYRVVFEHSPMGLILFSAQGTIAHGNQQLATLMGTRLEKLLDFDFLHGAAHPGMRECLRRARQGEQTLFEAPYTSATGGRSVHLRALFQPLNETPPCRVIAILEDVTRRKANQRQLQDYCALVEHSQEIMAVVGADHRYRMTNAAMLRQRGRHRDRVLGQHIRDVVGRKTYEEIRPRLERCLAGEHLRFDLTVEYPLLGKRHLEATYSHIPGENGRNARVASVLRDVTDVRKAHEELIRAKDLAEAANQAKSEFLANMSHEIRTPLNGVMGMLQLLDLSELDHAQKEFVLAAKQSCIRLTTLLTDILDVCKIEAGRLPIRAEPFELQEVLNDVRDLFQDRADNKGLELHFHTDAELPSLLVGDAVRLRQVLFNLVGNAVKFTRKGGVDVRVDRLRAPGRYVRLLFRVTDTGIGIESDQIDYVFQVFTQVDGTYRRSFQGAGLGLPIVKRIVTLMGGVLSVESEPGKGSTFYCSLPFEPVPEGQEMQTRDQGPPPCEECRDGRALVVEDDEINRFVLRRLLNRLGMEVQEAADGDEALNILLEERFDIVFLDIQMPRMSGEEVLQTLQTDDRFHHVAGTPIVAVTAHAMPGDQERFLQAGATHYIAKPLDTVVLIQLVRECLREQVGS
ncbi:MAG: ATP-binding protein [Desulfovibrio sp.]|nr:ATP-binding protein [Desulfovibrio sp.]